MSSLLKSAKSHSGDMSVDVPLAWTADVEPRDGGGYDIVVADVTYDQVSRFMNLYFPESSAYSLQVCSILYDPQFDRTTQKLIHWCRLTRMTRSGLVSLDSVRYVLYCHSSIRQNHLLLV
jgi:hypothetical protein